jgi:predicted nucleotidyltransferase
MNTISNIRLVANEEKALIELKKRLSGELPGLRLILYGSKARGDSIPESDIDVLALFEGNITSGIKNKSRSIKYDIELKHDVVISLLIENVNYWQSKQAQSMPLHRNIDREGITV